MDWEVRRTGLESFAQTCFELGIRMEACEFGPDHVHLFVSHCKDYCVPQMAQRFKGVSSRRIRKELWENVKGKLWGDSFWADCYFAETVGVRDYAAIKKYIQENADCMPPHKR